MEIKNDYIKVGNLLALMLLLSVPMSFLKYFSLTGGNPIFHTLWLVGLWIPAIYVMIISKPFNRLQGRISIYPLLIALCGPLLLLVLPFLIDSQGLDINSVEINITVKQFFAVIFLNDILSGEIIWRGFVLPTIKKHTSFTYAMYLTTLLEILWKGPSIILLYLYGTVFNIGWLVNDFLMLIFMSVWLSWLYWISRKNLKIVVLSRTVFAIGSLFVITNTVSSTISGMATTVSLLLYTGIISYYISKTSNFLDKDHHD
jgi:hypothetical protein